jgi:hypothetical protein
MANYRGWVDPVDKLLSFRTAISHLVSQKDNFRVRMEKVTYPFVRMRPEEFPERIRRVAQSVLAVRGAVAVQYETHTLWHFERLTPKERKAFITDILRLYEALLLDLGRMGDSNYDSDSPKD